MKLLRPLMIAISCLVILYIYNYNQISKFRVKDIKIQSAKIKESLKITQITDFHSNNFVDIDLIVKEIEKFDPDFIVLTGDIIDHKDPNLDVVIPMLENIKKLNKDIYFVQGNHEMRNGLYSDFKSAMEKFGVTILEDDSESIMVNDEKINIIGLVFTPRSRAYEEVSTYNKIIDSLDAENFNLLLLHSPNNIDNFINSKVDLVLSGHTHGGQVRLPIIGAVVAPGQKLFPKYDKGIFEIGNLTLYIDSGLGNSAAPLRGLNPIQFSNITIEQKK